MHENIIPWDEQMLLTQRTSSACNEGLDLPFQGLGFSWKPGTAAVLRGLEPKQEESLERVRRRQGEASGCVMD